MRKIARFDFKGEMLDIVQSFYPEGDRVSITSAEENCTEIYSRISINVAEVEDRHLTKGDFVAKVFGAESEVVKAGIAADIFEDTGKRVPYQAADGVYLLPILRMRLEHWT